jgi:hypothetical protein
MTDKNSDLLSIQKLLAYYHGEVVPALATAVTLDHAFPQEVLNEVRNALTHMGRANALDPEKDGAQKELQAAKRHLMRCTLDSLKVILLSIAKRCDGTLTALNREMLLPASVNKEAHELRRRRIEVGTHEGQHPIDDIVEKLKVLCDDYDKFSEKIHSEFTGDALVEMSKGKRLDKWVERLWGFLLGTISGVAVTYFMS